MGGKVAVNHPLGKNLIGAFYQPKLVFIDINTLKSLSKKDLINGLSEMVKYGLILNKDFFIFLEKNIKKIINLNEKILISAIKRSCEIKKKVIEKDEKEKNFRKILNFGHTIGHSLELVSKYKLSHGEAVSIGIVAEAQISKELNLLKNKDVDRVKRLLEKANLPVKLPKNIDSKKLIYAAKFDKKSIKKIPHYVLLERIGKAKLNVKVPNKIISKVLDGLK
jgi:3-dehydroquinate synthase